MEIYKSRIGLFSYLYLSFFVGLALYSVFKKEYIGLAIFIPVCVVCLWIFINTRYAIDKEYLNIMPFGTKIPLKDITGIERAENYFFSSPALSLKRIMIKYKNGSVFISPEDQQGLIASLKQKCINLKYEETPLNH